MIALPKWLPLQTLQDIFAHIQPLGECRLVGGCVREILLHHETLDIDIATQALPEQVFKTLKAAGYKCFKFGLSYGTITVITKSHKLEITSLRSDIKTYGRKAEVQFCRDWEEDAKRRDFTINAMYLDLDGHLYDYHNGQSDLLNGTVKFIGIPRDRIKEDYLRIMRYFRFLAYLPNSMIDQESFNTCKEEMSNVKLLSAERIKGELFKILGLQRASVAITQMLNATFFSTVLDMNIQAPEQIILCRDPLANFCYLLYLSDIIASSEKLKTICNLLKLSNHEKSLTKTLLEAANDPIRNTSKFHKVFLYRQGIVVYHLFMLLLALLEAKPTISNLSEIDTPIFPITGSDLKTLGFTGKDIGTQLKKLEQAWIDSDFRLTKEELLKA